MQSEIAQKAVEMGFDPVKVERAILEKIRQSGQGYSSVENLLQDVLRNSEENDPEVTHGNDGRYNTALMLFCSFPDFCLCYTL